MDLKGRVLSFEDHLPLIKASTQLALRIEYLRSFPRLRRTGKQARGIRRRLRLALEAYDALEHLITLDNEDSLDCMEGNT